MKGKKCVLKCEDGYYLTYIGGDGWVRAACPYCNPSSPYYPKPNKAIG